MSAEIIRWLPSITKENTGETNQKAITLSKIYSINLPTPPAFILTSTAFESILKLNNGKQKIKDIIHKATLANAKDSSQDIQDLILKTPFPPALEKEILEAYDNFNVDLNDLQDSPGALAILKSAREPIFVAIKTDISEENQKAPCFINIKGNREILEKIKECYAKTFSEKLILNYKESSEENLPKISIIIQKMTNSEKIIKAFSKNPIENDESILIKAAFGQKLIPDIIPDNYTLSKNFEILKETIPLKKFSVERTASGTIKTKTLNDEESAKRVLKTYEIKQVAELISKLEEIFKCPQVATLAIENKEITILNSKPIPNYSKNSNEIKKIEPPVNTRTKITTIIDPTLFEEEIKQVGPKEIIIKLENLLSTQKKNLENNLEEYQSTLEKAISKITKEFDSTPNWIILPTIKDQKNSGTTFLLNNKSILKATLLAIKKASNSQSKIILPKITSPEEIASIKEILNELEMSGIPIGISLETPAASILIKDLCESKIDLISFDIKNLTKLTIASHEHPEESSWAVLKQISRVIREAKKNNIETSIHSGDIENPKILKFLIKQKISSIALTPIQTLEISKQIQSLEIGEEIEPIDNFKEIKREIKELEKEESAPIESPGTEPTEETIISKKEDIFN